MPGDKWKTEEYWRYDRFIEVQVWDNRQMGNAKDAIFDLMDAVLGSATILSFVSRSPSPVLGLLKNTDKLN